MLASAVIADVLGTLRGDPVYLAGSLVAEDVYGKSNAHSDVDLFCPNMGVTIAVGQKLLDANYTFDERFDRVWYRWLRYGTNKWHTNSLRLIAPSGMQTNLVHKLIDGHPTTSLGQVLESFDFGLLAAGYDVESGVFRDMRGYLFPGLDPAGPLPMMPNKRDNWRRGFISKYNGIRQMGRYAKYLQYGYDLSLVKDDLVTGYREAELYFSASFSSEHNQLGKIYSVIADYIEDDNVTDMLLASKEIDFNDELDVIFEALT